MRIRLHSSITLILLVVILSFPAIADVHLQLHNEGNLTLHGFYYRCKSGALMRPTVDCAVVVGEQTLTVFELRADTLYSILDTTFAYQRIVGGRNLPGFAVCDFDGSGRDEILLCLNDRIMKWEWDGGKFRSERLEFPYYIIDCVSGDVFNDGKNYLVTASLQNPSARKEQLRIHVTCIDTAGINIAYETIEDIDMTFTTLMPPDHLVCVGDIHNDGQMELVISMAQSDVSPTRFQSYAWNADSLSFELKNKFSIINNDVFVFTGDLSLSHDAELSTYVSGGLNPIELYGWTHLLASEFGELDSCRLIDTANPKVKRRPTASNYGSGDAVMLLTISDDLVSCRRFRKDDVKSPYSITYIEDADGSDSGLLVVTHEYFDRPWPESEPVGWFRYFIAKDD